MPMRDLSVGQHVSSFPLSSVTTEHVALRLLPTGKALRVPTPWQTRWDGKARVTQGQGVT